MDIPYTPIQGYGTRYFSTRLDSNGIFSGDGWGGGISFMLVNPFIAVIDYRKLSFANEALPENLRSFSQFYLGLSFSLL